MDNKNLPDPLTERMKANAEKLSKFFGYVVPSITSIDMREMYCQGYLQAIQDLQKPSLANVSATCLQGLLANPNITGEAEYKAQLAARYAESLLTHLENEKKW